MKMSTRGRYGLRLMVELALRNGSRPLLLRQMAQNLGVSAKYLHHLVTALRKSCLVKSVRGASGGYMLARPAAEITVGEVVHSLEGSFHPVDCLQDERLCDRVKACAAREVWKTLGEAIESTLSGITLAQVATRQQAKRSEALSFEI